MVTREQLKKDDVLTNDELTSIFRCSPQGGMRRSLKTNSLVLISHRKLKLYREVFQTTNGLWHFTGMGQVGDQSLDYMQNRTLLRSNHEGIEVHLFNSFEKGEYTYIGQVRLANRPYDDEQRDRNEDWRKAYIFPLIEVGKTASIIDFLSSFSTEDLCAAGVFQENQFRLSQESVRSLLSLMQNSNVDTLEGPGGWFLSAAGFYYNPNAGQYETTLGSITNNETWVFHNQNQNINPHDSDSLVWERDRNDGKNEESDSKEEGLRVLYFDYQVGKSEKQIHFIQPDKDWSPDNAFTTLLIGPNGTGKSTILSNLQSILYDLYELSTSQVPRTLPESISYVIEYQLGKNRYQIKREFDIQNHQIVYQILINDQNASLSRMKFPNRLIALSFTVTDRFPDSEELSSGVSFYNYLGVRNIITKSRQVDPTYQLVQNILKAAPGESFLENVKHILEFIQVEPQFQLVFYTRDNMPFSQLLSPKKLAEIQHQSEIRFDPFEFIDLYGLQSQDSDEKVFIFEDNRLLIQIDLKQSEQYERYFENFVLVQSMMELGILERAAVHLLKDKYFEMHEASSGEAQYLSTMINILSKIDKNSIVLIDEPETSLHPNWQNQYIHTLKQLFRNFSSCHFFLATHSHFMVADLEQESSSIVSLTRNVDKIVEVKLHDQDTFGWSVEDVLLNIFDLPTTRNQFLADQLDRLLMQLSLGSMENESFAILNKIRAMHHKMKDADPLKEVVRLISERAKEYE